jgi:hypothetical protein
MIKYEEAIKDKIRSKLEEILGVHQPSSHNSTINFEEASMKTIDKQQMIYYEDKIKLQIKNKLEEILGVKYDQSDD